MGEEVTGYIDNLGQAWQAEVCRSLDQMVHQAIPEVTERLQYGKPHYMKDGKYAAVVGASKGWVTLTIFNTAGLDAPEGLLSPGPPERKTVKIRQGQAVNYDLLATLLQHAASAL